MGEVTVGRAGLQRRGDTVQSTFTHPTASEGLLGLSGVENRPPKPRPRRAPPAALLPQTPGTLHTPLWLEDVHLPTFCCRCVCGRAFCAHGLLLLPARPLPVLKLNSAPGGGGGRNKTTSPSAPSSLRSLPRGPARRLRFLPAPRALPAGLPGRAGPPPPRPAPPTPRGRP